MHCDAAPGNDRLGASGMMVSVTLRLPAERLREIPSLTGEPQSLAMGGLPIDPVALFVEWFDHALEAGVAEPHAATLATVDRSGIPDARTLILKSLDERGWAVAGSRFSQKAEHLAVQPAAALNFWWQPIMRAVRVRGVVEEASRAESDADLAARSASARAGIEPGEWVVWRIRPVRVEFWQASFDRRHTRIVYTRADGGWSIDNGLVARDGIEDGSGEEQ